MAGSKKKIFVGMSGGVDSSVSAALLKKEGHDVVGVFIKVWQADFLPCTWREERRDAMRAVAHLNIPFVTLDLEMAYKQEVVDYMIREYGEGRVPNPDVMCNKHVKFGAFLDFAKRNGADAIATGHYARVEHVQSPSLYKLLAGVDKEKDQSYFLWTLTQEQLAHTLFPIGHLQKAEVRKLAKEFGLPNAEKKDSQGLCFMGAVDMADFLKHYVNASSGPVLDVDGTVIGTHDGAMLYTIGQRHGFLTSKQSAHESPLFVASKDIQKNTITVSSVANSTSSIGKDRLLLSQMNWIPTVPNAEVARESLVRIRYRGTLHVVTATEFEKDEVFVTLASNDEFIAAGQSAVFYDGETCLGGGVIKDSVAENESRKVLFTHES